MRHFLLRLHQKSYDDRCGRTCSMHVIAMDEDDAKKQGYRMNGIEDVDIIHEYSQDEIKRMHL